MAVQVLSDRFRKVSLLSEGLLFQSWLGNDILGDRKVVIKRPLGTSEIPADQLSSILRSSYAVVRHWRHPGILSPLAGREREAAFEIVTRFIPDERRVALDSESFLEDPVGLVEQIFTAVEFIHISGYVHCDLKPENIFLERVNGRLKVRIGDLDLVRAIGSRPGGKISGTQPFIAPEIVDNEVIVAQSDNYALGVILHLLCCGKDGLRERLSDASDRAALLETGIEDSEYRAEVRWLAPIVRALVQRQYQLRPASLLRLLFESRPEAGTRKQEICRHLLWRDLASEFRKFQGLNHKARVNPARFLMSFNRIFGVPGEILRSAEVNQERYPRRQAAIMRELIWTSEVSLSARRWLLKSSREQVLATLDRTRGSDAIESDRRLARRDAIRAALRRIKAGELLAGASLLESILQGLEPVEERSLSIAIQIRLAKLYRRAGFADAANRIFAELNAEPDLSLWRRLAVLLGLVDSFQIDLNRSERLRIVGKAYGIARTLGIDYWRVGALEKWVGTLLNAGEIDRAYRFAVKIDKIASSGFSRLARVSAANSVMNALQQLGRLEEAEGAARRCLSYINTDTSLIEITLRSNLSMTLSDLGRYREAIAETERVLVLKAARIDPRRTMLPRMNAATPYLFLGEYAEAENSLSDYLVAAQSRGDQYQISWYLLSFGWLCMRSGRLAEAQEHLDAVVNSLSDYQNDSVLGRALLYLAIVNCWKGNLEMAREYADQAHAIYLARNDSVFILDTLQIGLVIEREAGGDYDVAEARRIVEDYLKTGNTVGAVFTLSQLMLEDEYVLVEELLKKWPVAGEYCRSSGAVIGKALLLHLRAARSVRGEEAGGMGLMREALMYYRKVGYYYHASRIARAIAESYLSAGKHQLARSYFVELERLANIIGNRNLAEYSSREIAKLELSRSSLSAKYQAMFEASELVNSLEDYNGVTHKLLLFALEQTGAERAALLLATDGSSDLRVEAKVDCDKISLKDILDMSRNVMNAVFKNSEPLIVSDAQTNELTREYRSVIKHNIFSIACVPLLTGGKVVGVLYLDHHSLPSVFSSEERRFVEAVANFIGAVLVRARMIDVAQRRTRELTSISAARGFGDSFITRNPSLIRLIERVPQVADSRATILLRGESGTGKEVMASIIHQRSPYHGGPLVTLNCVGLEGDVLESTLFGIEAGVATGVSRREGKIRLADGGTLFLDEIGDMPMSTQGKLLRVLEEREVEMIGGRTPKKVDFRLVVATNRNLSLMVENSQFREDFFYRINTIEIVLPPLRERLEDIEPLIEHFAAAFAPGRKFTFTREARRLINEYRWPGNVRELRNLVERLSIQAGSDQIDEEMLTPEMRKSVPTKKTIALRDYTEQAEKALMLKVLIDCNWNQSAAARKLDLPFTTLQRRLRRYKIKIPRKHN